MTRTISGSRFVQKGIFLGVSFGPAFECVRVQSFLIGSLPELDAFFTVCFNSSGQGWLLAIELRDMADIIAKILFSCLGQKTLVD